MYKTLIIIAVFISACGSSQTKPEPAAAAQSSTDTTKKAEEKAASTQVGIADAATILAKKQVPVLCYHQIRNWKGNESRLAKDVIVPPAVFKAQLQLLADSGYKTISPDEYYAYLTQGAPLPEKPVMLTYDDSDLDQYTIAAPEMEKHGFKGVYFIMTVSLGRSIYMNKDQIKDLAERGHIIGLHTWDHQNVTKYKTEDWPKQVGNPAKQLEALIGKPIKHFAYPFGAWNKNAIPNLKEQGMETAYQLSTARDSSDPLYTLRRMIVPGDWSAQTMYKAMQKTFK